MSTVLTIAGTDSIGGAGIAADLKAIASMDLHGCCVVTAVTSQNTQGVSAILPVPANTVATQLDAVFDDLEINAVKTGMIYSAEIADVVARKLGREKVPLVVDPVLCAGAGSSLFREGLKTAMFEKIFPLATIVTPNRGEAEAFAAMKINGGSDPEEACRLIAKSGAEAVLLKGGHFDGPSVTDLLFHGGKFTEFTSPRLPIMVHGSGCTLSSYIASHLAKGYDMKHAVAASKRRVNDAIAMSENLGKGMAIVNPMATKQKEAMRYGRIESLSGAVKHIETILPTSFIPKAGIDFVYSLPNPQDFFEVCAAEGGIQECKGHPKRMGDIVFGSSVWISRAVMRVNSVCPEIMAGIEIRHNNEIEALFKGAGLMVMKAISEGYGVLKITSDDAKSCPFEQLGLVPDALLKFEGMDEVPRFGIIGKDPDDILRKIGPCLDGVTR